MVRQSLLFEGTQLDTWRTLVVDKEFWGQPRHGRVAVLVLFTRSEP